MHNSIGTALLVTALAAGAVSASPAQARDEDKSILEGDTLTIGLGALERPSYNGSDDYVLAPIPAIRGRIEGVTINPRQGGVALDVIPDTPDAKIDFALGPMASVSLNRTGRIKDPVVRAAGKLDTAIEVGASAGVTVNRVLHGYDWLTVSVDVKRDVAGAYDGVTWMPSVSYSTPVSKAVLVTAMAYAHHAGDKYARYYYSVTPAQAAASGLPEYSAKGGWDKVGVGTLVAWDLSGNLLDGGWSVLGLASYSRMLGDGQDTPYTALRGSKSQWMGGLGIAYTF
ncbi:MipA/OmpV family protein [Novosphingobium sp. 1949]|uniref:MipA/OmpV family protein n=1 Tax=Novosphingobium organovorum TaxID=2930092 RepID=A0ABT0BGH4_9SPHN|nr:MipA/OmpV family protein [Novosphingobium organovorum]MCJ2184145.1 MipA/OmpV family protein [Novosphingobium organovorum]